MQYEFGKYKYFDKLVLINNSLDVRFSYDGNIRDYSVLRIIDELLKKFYIETSGEQNIDELCFKILKLTGSILMLQPFYDGNSRTLKTFISYYFASKGIVFVVNNSEIIMPTFYKIDDVYSSKYIKVLKSKLTYKS